MDCKAQVQKDLILSAEGQTQGEGALQFVATIGILVSNLGRVAPIFV